MSQPAPNASGTLAATPLGHLLIHLLDRRMTGSLVLEEPDHKKHAVYFVAGAPAAARTSGVVALLGELAVERGAATSESILSALETARAAGKRLGEVLVEGGVERSVLEELLGEQVARRVRALATLPGGTAYGFYDGRNFLERAGGPSAPARPLPLIWQVLRDGPDALRSADALARLQATTLRFHADAPLARFEFNPREQAVVDVVRAKPQPLAELAGRELVAPPLLERLVYALLLTRQFDLGAGTLPVGTERRSISPAHGGASVLPAHAQPAVAPPVAAPPPAPAVAPRVPAISPPAPAVAPAAATPATPGPLEAPAPARAAQPSVIDLDDPLRVEAAQRANAGKQSYYEVLGVPQDAPQSAIAAAYFQLAKRWHPDRLGAAHADLRDTAMRIFARIGEAHQVLADADQRAQYDELLARGEGAAEEQEQVQRVLRAATSFQKAQVMLKRNNLAGAEEAARAALADAPEEADHIALVAWLEALKPGADLDAHLRQLNHAVRLEESNLRVRWYRGQILKRLGRERQALEDFRLIAERDPRHVDAQREIRLFEMQRGRRPASDAPAERRGDTQAPARSPTAPPAEKGSFFGKLFKK